MTVKLKIIIQGLQVNFPLIRLRLTLPLCLIIYSNEGANLESKTNLQQTKLQVLFFELAKMGN